MIKKALALSPGKTDFAPLFFSGDIEEGIRQASNLGFDGVELSVNNPDLVDKISINKHLRAAGLLVATIATGQAFVQDKLFFCSSDPEVRRLTVERVKRQLEFAASVESEHLTIGGIRGKASSPVREDMAGPIGEAILACCERAGELGVKILIEPVNHYEVSYIFTIGQALDFINKLNHPALGLLYDTYHANIEEESLYAPLLAAGERLSHVHFADNNRMVPGLGCFNFIEVIRILKQLNYNGYICIEALPFPDSRQAARQAAHYLNAVMKESA